MPDCQNQESKPPPTRRHPPKPSKPLNPSATELPALRRHLRTERSRRRRLEQHLQVLRERLQLLTENCPDPFWIVYPKTGERFISPSIQSLFGYTPEEYLALRDDQKMPRTSLDLIARSQRAARRSANPSWPPGHDRVELLHNRKHGDPIWIEITTQHAFDADGSVRATVGTIRDISQRKANEARFLEARGELEKLARKAQESSGAKSRFMAYLSHELRNPLNAIIGCNSLLAESESPEERAALTQTIDESSHSLREMLNDIVDFVRAEEGQIHLDSAPFSPSEVVLRVREMLLWQARRQNLEFTVEITPGFPARFMGDASRFRQIVVNLVGNALKFTPQGAVRIRLRARPTPARRQRKADARFPFSLEVEDTGIGMPPDKVNAVFEPFRQASHSTHNAYGGSGLGLAISRQIAQVMGGDIRVCSAPGQGSTFTLDLALPLAREA